MQTAGTAEQALYETQTVPSGVEDFEECGGFFADENQKKRKPENLLTEAQSCCPCRGWAEEGGWMMVYVLRENCSKMQEMNEFSFNVV